MENLAELSRQAAAHNPALTAETFHPGGADVLPPAPEGLPWVDPSTIPRYRVHNLGWQKAREETDLRGELPAGALDPSKLNTHPALMINPPGQEADSGMDDATFQALVDRGNKRLYRPNSTPTPEPAQPSEKFPTNPPYVAKNEATVAMDAITTALPRFEGPDNRSATTLLPRMSARLAEMRARRASRSKPFGYTPRHRNNGR